MKMNITYKAILLLTVLAFSFVSCQEDDEVDTKSCSERAADYQSSLEEFVDFLNSDDEEAPSCADLKSKWDPVVESYDALCDESKTTETTENYNEVSDLVDLYAALAGCDL